MPNLIVERGREKGTSVELVPGAVVVVGRDPQSAQVVIADPAASRRHFQLAGRNGRWFVADLGSRNFTFLNEEKLEKEAELTTGDRIQVGETVFTFNDEAKGEDKAAGLHGKEIGGFRMLERLGRGGMGTVYKAKQISLNRLVALKFLSPKLAKDPSFVEKFFAEARAAAQLNHPNVVQVFDVGTLGGAQYFSMEFMEGGCVQDLLSAREDSRLPWQEAMAIMLDATRGLVFAEKRGIIHRDIKPDNLMLTSEQKVKIGDLGLATSAESEKEKGIFGTPHFIAPEQAQGRTVTHAADLYSLGATFYRILAGKTPFTGNTVKEILRAQINDPHVPIPQLVPDFPPELSAIIDRLMAKKVENRYQSATKLLEDLEAFQLAHHIEMAGGVKSRKPFLIALGVLGVALAAVAIWAATRDPEVRNIRGATVIIERTPTSSGPARTPEEIQREINLRAKSAFDDVEKLDLKLVTISLEKKAEWQAVAADYDGLRAKHPKATEHLDKAEARATTIRVELERLEELQNTVVKAAKEWWKQLDEALKTDLADGRWGDRFRRAKSAAESKDLEAHRPHLAADGVAWLLGVPESVIQDISKRHAEKLDEAQKLFDADDMTAAAKVVDDWTKFLEQQAIDDPRVKNLLTQAAEWKKSRGEDYEAKTREQLQTDKDLFIDAYRSVRHLPKDATDTGGLVFSLRFAEAAAEIRKQTEGRVKTQLYRGRVEFKAAQLEAAQAAWSAFTKLLGEKKIWLDREEIKGAPGVVQGAKAFLDPEKPATTSEVYLIVAVGGGTTGGTTKRSIDWETLTPEELFRIFIAPRLTERVPQDVALQLAHMFAELGDGDSAGLLHDRRQPPRESVAWLLGEIQAAAEFDRMVAQMDGPPAETLKNVDAWRRHHFRSDYSLLVDGRPAADMPHLFADEEIERFVDSWNAKK